MKKKKVFRLLKALDDRELDRFVLFLKAEFFSGDPLLPAYVEALRGILSDEDDTMEEEAFFALHFPSENFDYKRMSRVASQVVALLYRFLAVEFVEEDDLRSWSLVLEALEQRRQEEPLSLTLSAVERALKRSPESVARRFQEYRLLEILAWRPPGSGRQGKHISEGEIREALDGFYELARLRLDCSALNRKLVFGEPAEQAAEAAETSEKAAPSLAELYRHVKANLEAPGDFDRYHAFAEALSTALESQRAPFSFDLREVCRYALNGCVRLLNLHPRRKEPREMLRRLYEKQLKAGVIFENGLLPPWHFKNMVQNLVLLGDFEAAARCVDSYSDRLQDDYKQNAVVFAKAYLAFHQDNFAEARSLFTQLLNDYKDVFYGLDGRMMLLRSLFELGEVGTLQHQQEAVRVFLHRLKGGKAISEAHLNLYRDALRHFQKLSSIEFGDPDKRKARMRKFAEELAEPDTVLHRDWFLQKAGG